MKEIIMEYSKKWGISSDELESFLIEYNQGYLMAIVANLKIAIMDRLDELDDELNGDR